jgi:hypothetical protein
MACVHPPATVSRAGIRQRLVPLLSLLWGLLAALSVGAAPAAPPTLAATGYYANGSRGALAPGILPFEPQYPLWTDGAHKRRWILLPPGTAIDASDPEVWVFPVGTRFWKEFAFDRPIETRYMERLADGTWLFAAYAWNEEATEAVLAPERGVRHAAESAPGVPYDIPGRVDCLACHGGHPATVLGFSTLQLSPDRDPRAPNAYPPPPDSLDLAVLVKRGLVTGLPEELVAEPPRIWAANGWERAALGYLHGNCAHCHNERGPLADLGLSLAVKADGEPEAVTTALGRLARYRPAGAPESLRIAAGDAEDSLLVKRLSSREPLLQMPPLGTRRVDREALAVLTEWIRLDLVSRTLVISSSTSPPQKKRRPNP